MGQLRERMSENRMGRNAATIEEILRGVSPWGAESSTDGAAGFDMPILNARAVEFIAKPGKNSELCKCIGTSVLKFLERQPGFKGSFVLTPHREPRLVLIFSFWETEMDSRENHWECATEVRRAVSPLVDSFSRVRTYEATFPEVPETTTQPVELQPC
jgi:heme-degrading monooxygenase HmoA